MPWFLVKEHLNTKCPKLGKMSLPETLSSVTNVVVAMVIVITSVIGGFI